MKYKHLIYLQPLFFSLAIIMFVACNKKSSNESDISYNRETISLNGFWQIEDCISDTVIPQAFHHTVPVPGLVNLATPSFKDAGRFISREVANHPLYKNPDLPSEAKTAPVGVSLQERNYFWYRRSFMAPDKEKIAILKINKSQFGTEVWLNDEKVGQYTYNTYRPQIQQLPGRAWY
ncbi:MAG: beta galactosidase jelly roll domain-containing protein, partial [Mariniphaga sp.]